jgi:sulfatase maturation enzyme AslB (radical SAM superfamily)
LGDKFHLNGYKFEDLSNDREKYGRNYKKCLGSQISPCVGADGHIYVCTNHRGWKQYSYGCLYDDKSFKQIWQDIQKRQQVMNQIENVECFKNCTKLCKPHESNKAMWQIYKDYASSKEKTIQKLKEQKKKIMKKIKHPEFI